MIIQLKKAYKLKSGRIMPRGKVFNRMRKEAQEMIQKEIAEEYVGPYPPKKMKSEIFKPKNKEQWQQQEQ